MCIYAPMHVDAVPNRGSRPAYLLRESFREGSKVRKRTLANLSALPDEQIVAIRAVLVRAAQQSRSDRVQITQDDVLRGLRREATLAGEGSSHAARVPAWGLIGKHLGMFVERRQQLGEDGQPAHSQLFTVQIS